MRSGAHIYLYKHEVMHVRKACVTCTAHKANQLEAGCPVLLRRYAITSLSVAVAGCWPTLGTSHTWCRRTSVARAFRYGFPQILPDHHCAWHSGNDNWTVNSTLVSVGQIKNGYSSAILVSAADFRDVIDSYL